MFFACPSAARLSFAFSLSRFSPRAVRCELSRQRIEFEIRRRLAAVGAALADAHTVLPVLTPAGCGRVLRMPVSGVPPVRPGPTATALPTPIVPAFGAGTEYEFLSFDA